MQFYLNGITPLFWKQIESQPTGLYNLNNFQASSAAIDQTFVTFIDKPIGTRVDIFMNGALQSKAIVVDASGFIYAKFPLPYTINQDSIDVEIREEVSGLVIQAENFATSHIAFLFEIQADLFNKRLAEAVQLEQNVSIAGVDSELLESKFGVFTGLTRRSEQTSEQYRAQTACLWKSYMFASMEEGLVGSLKCLLGTTVAIIIKSSRDIILNRIFYLPQFGDQNDDVFDGITLARKDSDIPHFYMPEIDEDFRTEYTTGNTPPLNEGTPLDTIINPGTDQLVIDTGETWDSSLAQPFGMKTVQAHGSEVIIEIGSTEADAGAQVVGESVERRQVGNDQLATINILPTVIVSGALDSSGNLLSPQPIENTDFIVDRAKGEILWTGPQIPEDGTTYNVDYTYRLDVPISIVIKKIKPAHVSVVVVFQNVTSGLPISIEA